MLSKIVGLATLLGLASSETAEDAWDTVKNRAPVIKDLAVIYYRKAEKEASDLLLKVVALSGIWLIGMAALAAVGVNDAVLLMGLVLPVIALYYMIKLRLVVANFTVAYADHLPGPLKNLGKLKSLQKTGWIIIGMNAAIAVILAAVPFERNPRMLVYLAVLGIAAMAFSFGVNNEGTKSTLLTLLGIAALIVVGIVIFSGHGDKTPDTAQPPVERTQPAPKAEIQPMAPQEQPRAQQPEATPSSTAPDTPEPEAHHLPKAEPSLSALFQQHGTASGVRKYSVTVVNHGEGEAQNVVIEQKLPDDVSFTDGSRAKEWRVDSIEPGHSVEFLADIDISDSPVGSTYTTVISVDADNYNGFHFKEVVEDA